MAEYMKATEEGNVPMTAFEIADLIATRESIQADKIERNVLRTREAAKQYIDKYITGVGLALLSAGVAGEYRDWETDRKSTRLNSSHSRASRMPSSA